jgi:holo-[acyl-carrier protein] synthase
LISATCGAAVSTTVVMRALGRRRRAVIDPAVGVDIVEVEAVAAALASPRAERYLELVYTAEERSDCAGAHGVEASRLAARFAAKEAVRKAIGGEIMGLPWRSIEVVRAADGQPSVRLDGRATAAAKKRGLRTFAVSLSHEPAYAAAVVVGTR